MIKTKYFSKYSYISYIHFKVFLKLIIISFFKTTNVANKSRFTDGFLLNFLFFENLYIEFYRKTRTALGIWRKLPERTNIRCFKFENSKLFGIQRKSGKKTIGFRF